MRVVALTVSGEEYFFDKILYLKIQKSLKIPADSLHVKLAVDKSVKDLSEVRCFEGKDIIFEGYVDEQLTKLNKNGCILTLTARNRVAKLLDNEALPRVYNKPSFSDIFSVCCKGYGFKGHSIDAVCPSDFSVAKGMSEWDVIEKFCTQVIGKRVFVDDDKFFVELRDGSNHHTISNTSAFGIRFSNAQVRNKRYGVISRIDYKIKDSDDYAYMIENGVAVKKGISVKRFINLGGYADWRNRAILSQKLIKAMENSFSITVDIPMIVRFKIGDKVDFLDDKLGTYTNLVVNEYSIVVKNNGCYTQLLIAPEIDYNDGRLSYGMVSE